MDCLARWIQALVEVEARALVGGAECLNLEGLFLAVCSLNKLLQQGGVGRLEDMVGHTAVNVGQQALLVGFQCLVCHNNVCLMVFMCAAHQTKAMQVPKHKTWTNPRSVFQALAGAYTEKQENAHYTAGVTIITRHVLLPASFGTL